MIKDLSKEYAQFLKHKDSAIKMRDFEMVKKLAREFMMLVYHATSQINPSLRQMINDGEYDDFYLYDSTKCYLQYNFNIFGHPINCPQCGEIH